MYILVHAFDLPTSISLEDLKNSDVSFLVAKHKFLVNIGIYAYEDTKLCV